MPGSAYPGRNYAGEYYDPVSAAAVVLSADPGTYSVAGSAAGFDVGEPASPGAYAVSGAAAGFNLGLPGGVGAYAAAGQPAGVGVGLPAVSGSYVVLESSAGLGAALGAAAGAFAVAGFDAVLETGSTSKVLMADPGAYSVSGFAADLTVPVPEPVLSTPTPAAMGGAPPRERKRRKAQRRVNETLALILAETA